MATFMVPRPILDVAARLEAHGYAAVVVGGAVRDQLLGRPAKDWDLATSATPDQVVALFPGTRATTRFGTALVPAANGEIVEVTTFRTEAGYADFRRPDKVAFTGSLEEDLARRDFTMNAIAYDPIRRTLIDPYRGQVDLAARRIRAVGVPAERFGEDALRLLRAVRFVAQLGFSVEPATAAAMTHQAHLARHLAMERVGTEIIRMVTAPYAGAGLREMGRHGLAAILLPELAGGTFALGVATLDRVRSSDQAVALACLFHHATPDATTAAEAARRRILALGIGDDIALHVARITRAAGLPFATTWTEADLARAVRPLDHDVVSQGLAVRAACDAARTGRVAADTAELARRAETLYRSGLALQLTDLAINGNDLQAHLGIKPGPLLGRILNGLLEAVVERRVANTRPDLLALAAGMIR